jgi:hypothetical protein
VVDGVLVVNEFRKFLQETAGLGVDFDVADQIGVCVLRLDLFDERFDLLTLGADLRQIFRRCLESRSGASALLRQRPCQRYDSGYCKPGPSHHASQCPLQCSVTPKAYQIRLPHRGRRYP